MNILIVGVSGFIGNSLYHTLSQDGHHIIGCSRNKISGINWVKCNFKQNQYKWEQQLQKIDLVINAIGIYQQSTSLISKNEGFSQVHDLGPKRLFDACRKHQIKVIQISAIGAEQDNPVSEFLQSKRNADQYLLSYPLPNVVLYPGIVLGEKGKSTHQLSLLARLSCIPLIFGKQKKLPMISIYQIGEYIKDIINNWPKESHTKILIAKPETMEDLLTHLRHWMNLKKGYFIVIPEKLTSLLFSFVPKLSIGNFNKQSVAMLADYSNRESPIEPSYQESASESLLKDKATDSFNKDIQITLLFYLNIFVLGLIWLVSGFSSIINIEQSRELISLIGINAYWADVIIMTAALGNILLGLLLWLGLWSPFLRRWVIYTQIAVMIIYTLILSIMIPIFWIHPFAPIVKNMALFILAMYLLVDEKK